MVRSRCSQFLVLMAFVGVLSLPALGDEVVTPTAQVATDPAPVQATGGCNSDADAASLPFVQDTEEAFCPAEKPESAKPEWLQEARPRIRTCRCSCGYPCRSDEDCGPGGRCTVGITCC